MWPPQTQPLLISTDCPHASLDLTFMATLSGKGGKEQSETQETITLRIGWD